MAVIRPPFVSHTKGNNWRLPSDRLEEEAGQLPHQGPEGWGASKGGILEGVAVGYLKNCLLVRISM